MSNKKLPGMCVWGGRGGGAGQGIKTNLEIKNIKLANKDIKRYNYILHMLKKVQAEC